MDVPRIAIQVAVHEELKPVLKRVRVERVFHEVTWEQRNSLRHAHHDHLRFYNGTMNGVPVVVFRTGVGRNRAREILRVFFEHFEPRHVISAGFGGALSPELNIGDIVMVDDICELSTGLCKWRGSLAANGQNGVHKGKLITADRMIVEAVDKTQIGELHKAIVVDMETSAVAALCEQYRVPLTGIRAISDKANEDLPPEINSFFDNGEVRPTAITKAIVTHPSTIIGLYKLAKHAWKAGDDLGNFLEKFVTTI